MNRFFKHVGLVIILAIIVGLFMDKFIFLFFTDFHKRFVTDIKDREYNLIFIGNSRSHNHFNPSVFDTVSHTNSVNLGLPGATAFDIYTNLKLYYLNNNRPKFVILNIDTFNNSNNDQPSLKNANIYLKYRDNKYLLGYFNKLYSLNYLFKISLLQYSITPKWGYKEIIKTLFKNEYFDSKQRGFANVSKVTVNRPTNLKNSEINLNNSYFDSIYSFCLNNRTKLFFVFTPMYRSNFTFKFKYPFIDNSKFLDSNIYFSNPNHLNLKGANIYSKYLSNQLRNKLKQ